MLILNYFLVFSDPECNNHPPVGEKVKDKLDRLLTLDKKQRSVKSLLSKEYLENLRLWEYICRTPEGIPLPLPEGLRWFDIIAASLRVLYGPTRILPPSNRNAELLHFTDYTMPNITINIPNTEELEKRRKAKLEKMKALSQKGIGETASSKEIVPSFEVVTNAPPIKRAKVTKAKKSVGTSRASSELFDIPEEVVQTEAVEAVDRDISTVRDVISCLDKGKSVRDEMEDYVLSISKNQLIEQNTIGNSEFCSKLLREVDGEHYNGFGYDKVLNEV